jgi:hypothetical protein
VYRFTKEFKKNGVTVSVGVQLRKNFILGKDCVSLIGSEVFKDIPMEYLEKFEPVKYAKKKRTKAIVAEKKSANARISSNKNLLSS